MDNCYVIIICTKER